MKINEILTESQLDELSALDAARGIGSAIGKTANTVGAGFGAIKGAWDSGKAGFQSGKNFVGGQRVGRTNAARPSGGVSAPVSSGNLDSMADQDLVAMKAKIDGILQARTQKPPVAQKPAPQATPQPASAPQMPAQGSVAPGNAPSSPAPVATPTVKKGIAKGTKAKGPDGQSYTWQGGAWVNDVNNRLANKQVAAALSKAGAVDNRIQLPRAAE